MSTRKKFLNTYTGLASIFAIISSFILIFGVVFDSIYLIGTLFFAILGVVYGVLGISDDSHDQVIKLIYPILFTAISITLLILSMLILFYGIPTIDPYETLPSVA